MESKHERFRRLSKSRGERLRKEIRLIGNLSNTKNYEYDKTDIAELFAPIDQALDEVRETFKKNLKG